ncbi:hypothetical protein ACQ4PT_033100 [Festuca glaucescens]
MAAKISREGGSSSSKPPSDLQELMKKLILKDEEFDDVVLPREEFVNLREGARWMAVVKVHTTRQVLHEGPWIFRQLGVLLEPYDGIADPNSVELDRIIVWVQVRGILPLFRKEELVKNMAARIGEVKGVDLYALGASGTSFVRVRVKLDVNKALTRFVGLHPEGNVKMTFQVLYEKLPKFCDVCGFLGHDDLKCGAGVHEEEVKQYGEWMMAPVEDWHPQTSSVRSREPVGGARGGRGAGRSRGGFMESRKCASREVRKYPSTTVAEAEKNATTMMLTDGTVTEAKEDPQKTGKNTTTVMAEVSGAPSLPPSPVKPPHSKKPRTTDSNNNEMGSAMEGQQSQ